MIETFLTMPVQHQKQISVSEIHTLMWSNSYFSSNKLFYIYILALPNLTDSDTSLHASLVVLKVFLTEIYRISCILGRKCSEASTQLAVS